MKIKYLYGKSKYLDDVISGKNGIRFSDLSHYSRLENEKMRDDEMNKTFIPRKENIVLEINGYKINKDELSRDPVFSAQPRHCYCICLSGKEDDEALYRDFKADTCIAIDVEELEQRLAGICERFKGSYFTGKEITYYDQATFNVFTKSPEDLVFYKPDFFVHENEYRIAWFYPLDKTGFSADGEIIPFRKEGESSHVTISHKDTTFITGCIKHVYTRD